MIVSPSLRIPPSRRARPPPSGPPRSLLLPQRRRVVRTRTLAAGRHAHPAEAPLCGGPEQAQQALPIPGVDVAAQARCANGRRGRRALPLAAPRVCRFPAKTRHCGRVGTRTRLHASGQAPSPARRRRRRLPHAARRSCTPRGRWCWVGERFARGGAGRRCRAAYRPSRFRPARPARLAAHAPFRPAIG